MVLLTGKQPDRLYNSREAEWEWSQIDASSHLKKVLKKMLAEKPRDRYQSVEQVYRAMTRPDRSFANSFLTRFRTVKVAPARSHSRTANRTNFATEFGQMTRKINRLITSADLRRVRAWQWGILASAIFVIPGLISFTAINYRITRTIPFSFGEDENLALGQNELDLQRQIHEQVKSLPLDSSVFYKQVDALFHQRYPELAGIQLSDTPEHQKYRQVWYQIASSLLAQQQRQRN